MADNYVEIKVKATDTAKPDLTDLRARLDELGSKVESARVDVEDKDAAAKLLALNAKLAALNKQAANPKITVAGAARVEAQLAAVDAGLDHVGGQSEKADVKVGGLRSRLLALGGAAGSVAGIGDAMTLASGEASTFQKAMAGASLATGLLEPAMAGVVVGAGGLASGLVAAGAGAGIFAKVTQAAFTAVSSNITAANTAYAQLYSATTTKQKQAALKALAASVKGLSGGQRQLVESTSQADAAWHRFVDRATSSIAGTLAPALRLVPTILAEIKPFLDPVEQSISGFVSHLQSAIQPAQHVSESVQDMARKMGQPITTKAGGLADFLHVLSANAGPALTKILTLVENLGAGAAHLTEAFMPFAQEMLSGLDKISAKFANWSASLTSHSGFQSLMSQFRSETPMAMKTLHNLATAIIHIGEAMTGLSTASNSKGLLQILGPLSGIIAKLSQNQGLDRTVLYILAAADAGKKMKSAFDGMSTAFTFLTGLPGKISSAVTAVREFGLASKVVSVATRLWAAAQWVLDAAMAANPLTLIIIAIVAVVAAIVLLTMKSKAFRAFWKAVWHDIEADTDAARGSIVHAGHDIENATDAVRETFVRVGHAIEAAWNSVVHGLSSDTDAMREDLVHFGHDVESAVDRAVSWFRSLPGRILGAIGNLGSLLFGAGQRVIQGLINGIESMVGSVGSAIGHIAGEITSHLPFSPAKKGPLSGAGDPTKSGRKITQMLAQGMTSGIGSVTLAAARVAGGASIGARGGAGGGAAGGRIVLQITGGDGTLTKALVLALRNEIRVQGGSVQTVLGH